MSDVTITRHQGVASVYLCVSTVSIVCAMCLYSGAVGKLASRLGRQSDAHNDRRYLSHANRFSFSDYQRKNKCTIDSDAGIAAAEVERTIRECR
jgi:hypothetical protein